jgi:Flp pilus assembly pilin Flp
MMQLFGKLHVFFADRTRRLAQNPAGATAVEYAMIASGIAVAIALAVKSLGVTIQGFFTSLVGLFH